MTFSLGMLPQLSKPWTALMLTTLALLAGEALGQSAPRPAAKQPPASRHAAKQVRLPEDKPVAKPTAKPSANKKPVRHDSQVRPVQHMESSVMSRSSFGGRTPRTAMRTASRMQNEMMPETIVEGETIPTPEGEMHYEHGELVSGDEGSGDGGCCGDSCGGNCGGGCANCCLLPCPRITLNNLEFFAGVEGFTGPLNRGESGSFGFHEGLNWGNSLPCQQNDFLSMQLGFQATQSSFAGSGITDEDRRQFFVTGGFFRRVDWGLQGGLVVDYLHDEWYYDSVELAQARGELSWVFPQCHELGFWFAHSINSTTSQSVIQTNRTSSITVTDNWQSTDLYAFFYRRRFEDCGASGRIFGGFTGESDGLIGADVSVPLSEQWAIRSGFTYLIPGENQSTSGFVEESWNVGISLVWYPGCRTARSHDYNRPLLNVADNGSFMVDRK